MAASAAGPLMCRSKRCMTVTSNVSTTFSNVTEVIRLAVAPVFLLSSVGTILGVLSTRLARITDRARTLAARLEEPAEAPHEREIRAELEGLVKRRRYVNLAISFGVATALLVCILISSAFVGTLLQVDVAVTLAVLFITAMLSFVIALLLFLREILISVASYRLDIR
jgi:hypothetical protein